VFVLYIHGLENMIVFCKELTYVVNQLCRREQSFFRYPSVTKQRTEKKKSQFIYKINE